MIENWSQRIIEQSGVIMVFFLAYILRFIYVIMQCLKEARQVLI